MAYFILIQKKLDFIVQKGFIQKMMKIMIMKEKFVLAQYLNHKHRNIIIIIYEFLLVLLNLSLKEDIILNKVS